MGLILIIGGLFFTVLIAVFFCCVKISNINKKNKQLEYDLYHDPATGHTNWAWLWERIGHTADQQALPYDFIHFDIKDFKA